MNYNYEVRQVPTAKILDHVDASVDIVVLSAVQYAKGYRCPLIKLGEACSQGGIPFILNATQSVGAFPIDNNKIAATAIVGSLHKWFCAGYGCSFFYLDRNKVPHFNAPLVGWLSVKDPMAMSNNKLDLVPTVRVNEAGVPNFMMIHAVKAALELILSLNPECIADKILELNHRLYTRLKEEGFEILSQHVDDLDWESSTNSGTLLVATSQAEELKVQLAEKNVYVSARSGALRIATHYYNNESDIEVLIRALKELKV